MICCCGSFLKTFLTSLQDTTTLDFPFSFSQHQLREQTLIQFDSRYLSKRVPTSLFPFKRGQFDVWMVGFLFWHHQPLRVSLPRLGVGLGIGSPCTFGLLWW